jgi:tellurite methyltransferase
MAEGDRERWDREHAAAGREVGEPSAALVELAGWLPAQGRALDVAGGAGANAAWLARRGLEVTIVDVSGVGLQRARAHAERAGVTVTCVQADLEVEALPGGPWALVLCCNYLQRDLVPRMAAALGPGGRLLWIHPTVDNLARHARPSARFLLQPGEARTLVRAAGLVPRVVEEAWVGPGEAARHLARVVAERVEP